MHHPMAYRRRQASDLGAQKIHDLTQSCGHVGRVSREPCLIDEGLALHSLREEPWMDANTLNMPF